ncbi:hypothetical protein Cgig2_016601 [Carnegiea gigantea]|uniref:D-glycerate 3-kinase, chloroplastic n=1 Tax=Carnegiea gigantea TaxID=171969 RepID=A0A9Q1KZP8_9CARY|nr:hypothetical protein Cgig2_016601 [Carnegiea gigantea]
MANTLNLLCQAVTPWPATTSLHSSTIKFSLSSKPLHQSPPSLSASASGCRCSWMEVSATSHINVSTNGRRQSHVYSVAPTTPAETSSVQNLFKFICAGPLLDKVGLTPEKVANSIDKWLTSGSQLCRLFQLNELYLNEAQKVRIYHYYIPVFIWCEDQISRHASMFKDGEDVPPLVIGFSAPQGCGKTTLVFALSYLFNVSGRKCATISIDDFYLTAEEQGRVREANAGNKLLESEYKGRGDRADPSTWPEIEGPLTAILFEGWMLGFKPVPDETVKAVDPQLETVNENLQAYYDAWDKFVKAWIVIKIKDPNCVYQWRLQAEQAMRADGKPGMSDEEVLDFVSRYLPAYNAYLPTLYSEGPNGSDPNRTLVIEIDEGRNPILGS